MDRRKIKKEIDDLELEIRLKQLQETKKFYERRDNFVVKMRRLERIRKIKYERMGFWKRLWSLAP